MVEEQAVGVLDIVGDGGGGAGVVEGGHGRGHTSRMGRWEDGELWAIRRSEAQRSLLSVLVMRPTAGIYQSRVKAGVS